MTKTIFILILSFFVILQSVMAGYLFDADEINSETNQLTDSVTSRVSMLFLVVLVFVSVIGFMIDYGSVGIVIGCVISLLVLASLGLVLINTYSFMSFILMCGMLIYKML